GAAAGATPVPAQRGGPTTSASTARNGTRRFTERPPAVGWFTHKAPESLPRARRSLEAHGAQVSAVSDARDRRLGERLGQVRPEVVHALDPGRDAHEAV